LGTGAALVGPNPVCDACQDDLENAQDAMDFADDIIESDPLDPYMPAEEPYAPPNTPIEDEASDEVSDEASDEVSDEVSDDTIETDTIDDIAVEFELEIDLFPADETEEPDKGGDGGKN